MTTEAGVTGAWYLEHVTRLLTWLSPSYPVGGYTYSHGIEYAVETGRVRDLGSLVTWIDAALSRGAGWTDAVLFVAASRAVRAGDEAALEWAAERADVMRGSSELALESAAQGTAFLRTVRASWAPEGLERWNAVLDRTGRPPAHAVAVAIATTCAGMPSDLALCAFLHGFAANLVSAGVRLVPLGQTDGQRAVALLDTILHRVSTKAHEASLEDLGSAAPVIDWAAMSHETQYTRLFRS
ncbi:urease accessory protein UreF [Skermanella stibiiresistens]|uniref:urease accessory protein UreF n=1 Tax=Skermanella stibiiresistens TaxID=913326 RepID=UPI000687DFC1|nr:urease accessory protein UreF [Skermanella stibiiresistens]